MNKTTTTTTTTTYFYCKHKQIVQKVKKKSHYLPRLSKLIGLKNIFNLLLSACQVPNSPCCPMDERRRIRDPSRGIRRRSGRKNTQEGRQEQKGQEDRKRK